MQVRLFGDTIRKARLRWSCQAREEKGQEVYGSGEMQVTGITEDDREKISRPTEEV